MVTPTEQQLLTLVHQSSTVGELDERVSHQFGTGHVAVARLLAVRVNGARWVFETDPSAPSEVYKTFRVLGRPQNIVLLLFSFLAVLALLWPPFVLAFQDGSSWHMGFFSIFDGPGTTRRGAVNVLLLAIELVFIASVGGTLYILAQRIERRNAGLRPGQ